MEQKCRFFVLLFGFIFQSDCFVTQLPDCGRYHGNFSERHDNQYFTTSITETVRNVTRRECTLHCTLHLGCLSFNHKMDGSICELLASYNGVLEARSGWQFVSTSVKNVHLRGPLCRYLGPKVCTEESDRGKHCADSCEAPGFLCKEDVNIAMGKIAKASSQFDYKGRNKRFAKFAIDGDPNTFWTPFDGPDPWLLVDLGERRFVAYFWWQHLTGGGAHYGKMKRLRIRVGDKNENDLNGNQVCAENMDHSKDRNNLVYCTDGPMRGRYVVLQKDGGANMERFFVNELKIFALD